MGDDLKVMLVKYHRKPYELANYLGVSKSCISKWFEKNDVPRKWHEKIAEFFATESPFNKAMKSIEVSDARSIYEIILPMTKDQKINVIQFILGTL